MKIITDYEQPKPTSKYDKDAAELIEAVKTDPTSVGAIEVNVLEAKDDADALAIIARETRNFQAATLKQGYSARSREVRDNGDGTNDVVFTITPKKERKARETVSPAEVPGK